MCVNDVHDLGVAFVKRWCARGPYRRGVCGVGVPLPRVPFDICHPPTPLILAHPNPSPTVSELEDPGAIEDNVCLESAVGD